MRDELDYDNKDEPTLEYDEDEDYTPPKRPKPKGSDRAAEQVTGGILGFFTFLGSIAAALFT